MKWSELRMSPETVTASARQTGKTALNADFMEKYLDWLKRGSPADEEIPPLLAIKLRVE